MSATEDGIVHYTVTRIALIDALGGFVLTREMNLEARGRMADALLAQMPVAPELVTEDQAREIMQATVEAQKPALLAEVAAATDARVQESMQRVVAAERERIAELAGRRKEVLAQPGNGYLVDAVPFAALLDILAAGALTGEPQP